MQLNIKNEAAHRMARELSRLTGESMTEAVIKALALRLVDERKRGREGLDDRIAELVAQMKALPVLDERPPDGILYDDKGLPA
jgi:antitoxin VapB